MSHTPEEKTNYLNDSDQVFDNSEIEKINALIVRFVNEFEAEKFNMTTLNMRNPENKSGISTNHQDTNQEKKERAVQHEEYHFIGSLNSEVSMFKRCLPNSNQMGLEIDFFDQKQLLTHNEEHDFSGQFNSEILDLERCLSCFKRIYPFNFINGSSVDSGLEEDRLYFKFHVRLTSEVVMYKCIVDTSGLTGGAPKEMSKKSIDAKNIHSIKKRFGNRKNSVSAKKQDYKRFVNKSNCNRQILSLGPVNRDGIRGVRKIFLKTSNTGLKYGKVISRTVESANPTPC